MSYQSHRNAVSVFAAGLSFLVAIGAAISGVALLAHLVWGHHEGVPYAEVQACFWLSVLAWRSRVAMLSSIQDLRR